MLHEPMLSLPVACMPLCNVEHAVLDQQLLNPCCKNTSWDRAQYPNPKITVVREGISAEGYSGDKLGAKISSQVRTDTYVCKSPAGCFVSMYALQSERIGETRTHITTEKARPMIKGATAGLTNGFVRSSVG